MLRALTQTQQEVTGEQEELSARTINTTTLSSRAAKIITSDNCKAKEISEVEKGKRVSFV